MISSSVPARPGAPRAAVNAWLANPPAPFAPCWKSAPARKRKELRDYESMWSKDASLGIRRDRETFSVRHRTAAHKARHVGGVAVQTTLLRRLDDIDRCIDANKRPRPKQLPGPMTNASTPSCRGISRRPASAGTFL